MTILLTGLGYIGARLALDLLAQGEAVVAVENFFSTRPQTVQPVLDTPGITLIEGGIADAATWSRVSRHGPYRAIVHLAAQPSSSPQAASSIYTELTNLIGSRLVCEMGLESGVERIVLGSSFKVYGDRLPAVVGESQPYGSVADLAHLGKIYAEKLAEMLAITRGLSCVAVRLGITYGLGPVMKVDPRFMTVPNRFCQLAVAGQALTIHATATQPAGFIHVADASRALQAALRLKLRTPYTSVNAVSECLTVGEVAGLVGRAAGRRGIRVEVTGPSSATGSRPCVESSLTDLLGAGRRMSCALDEVIDFFLADHQDRPGRSL